MDEGIELNDAELDGVAGGFSLDGVATAVGGAIRAVGGAAADAMSSAADAMNSTATALSAALSTAVGQAGAMNSVVGDIAEIG